LSTPPCRAEIHKKRREKVGREKEQRESADGAEYNKFPPLSVAFLLTQKAKDSRMSVYY
jgi:hypothetical protein